MLSALFCLFLPLSPNLHICCASFLSQSLSDGFALSGAWEETGPGTISSLPACIRAPAPQLGVFCRPLPLSSVRGAPCGQRSWSWGGRCQASFSGRNQMVACLSPVAFSARGTEPAQAYTVCKVETPPAEGFGLLINYCHLHKHPTGFPRPDFLALSNPSPALL